MQGISHQLSSMAAERQELAEQVKLHQTRSLYNEQLARAHEQDASGGTAGRRRCAAVISWARFSACKRCMLSPLPAELRTAYEGLSHETQRLQQSLTELTRELQARDAGGWSSSAARHFNDVAAVALMRRHMCRAPPLPAELVTRSQEIEGLHEAQRSAQSQINMYISDLQVGPAQL